MSKPKPADAELDDLFSSIRQTCDGCSHPRCLSIIKAAKDTWRDRTRAAPQEWHCYVCDRPIGKSITPLFLCNRRECRFKMGFVEVSWDAPAPSSGEGELDRIISSLTDGSVSRLKKKWQFNYSGRQALEMMADDIKLRAKTSLLAWHAQQVEAAYDRVDRLEVIDETGIAYEKWGIYGDPVRVKLSLQDDNRTLKVFVEAQAQKDNQ